MTGFGDMHEAIAVRPNDMSYAAARRHADIATCCICRSSKRSSQCTLAAPIAQSAIYIYIYIYIYTCITSLSLTCITSLSLYIYIYMKDRLSDAEGLGFESQTGRVTGRPTPSLWRDKHPAIEGLRPPEHHARHSIRTKKDFSESNELLYRVVLYCIILLHYIMI